MSIRDAIIGGATALVIVATWILGITWIVGFFAGCSPFYNTCQIGNIPAWVIATLVHLLSLLVLLLLIGLAGVSRQRRNAARQ